MNPNMCYTCPFKFKFFNKYLKSSMYIKKRLLKMIKSYSDVRDSRNPNHL